MMIKCPNCQQIHHPDDFCPTYGNGATTVVRSYSVGILRQQNEPNSSDLEQITRDLNEAVRLLRRWHTVDYPSEALEDITDAFLSRLATMEKTD